MEDKDIRQKLIVQTKFWNNKEGYEKGQCQQFWNSILRCFDPQIDLPNTIVYEKQVKDPATGSTKFIDASIDAIAFFADFSPLRSSAAICSSLR